MHAGWLELSWLDLSFCHRVIAIGQLQETCLYRRLNAALRNHDMRSLEPFLPYMKLLLSGLYLLPLAHVRTYRGVKKEIFEVITNPGSDVRISVALHNSIHRPLCTITQYQVASYT